MAQQKSKQRAVALMVAIVLFLSVFTVWGITANAAPLVGWQERDGNWYYYNNHSERHTGWLHDNGFWYYLDPENDGAMYNKGFIEIDGQMYYMVLSGRTIQNEWHQIKSGMYQGDWIKAYPSGVLITGWLQENSVWYYMGPIMFSGSAVRVSDAHYFFHGNGVCQTKAGWFKVTDRYGDTNWYFANPGGALKEGWFKDSGRWYYLSPRMLTNLVCSLKDGYYYHFDENGVCSTQTGWFKGFDDNSQHWFYRLDGGTLKVGWLKYRGKWYYLNPRMLTGGPYEINGQNHNFDHNGVWIP